MASLSKSGLALLFVSSINLETCITALPLTLNVFPVITVLSDSHKQTEVLL